MSNLDDLKAWYEKAPPKIQQASKIVTPDEYPSPYMFHISKNPKIKEFIPVIGRRQGEFEDRTTPRICVCPYLIGCMIGYADVENDFFINKEADKKVDKTPFLGGWKIYAFNYEGALKPTKKLVYDAKNSDECWLTSYNETTQSYTAKVVGEFFYTTMTYIARDKDPWSKGDFYLNTKVELPFTKRHILKPGHYRISGFTPQFVRDYLDDKHYEVAPVSEADYLKAKHGVADMLAFSQPDPIFLNWK
jgi:hypothetical protein